MIHWLRRLMGTFGKQRQDHEFDEELSTHLELLIEQNVKRGMNPAQARREAILTLGGIEPARELHRDTRGLPWLDTLGQDLRYTFRGLRRDWGFTVFAVLILGLGIGASVTVFSVVNALLLRPLPFRDPERLLWIANTGTGGMSGATTRVANFVDAKRLNKSFEDIGSYFAFFGDGDYNLSGRGEPDRLSGVQVSQNFFDVLGVQPRIGRLFTADECKWNGPTVVLLSDSLWKQRFSADPSIVGQSITLNDKPATIVGVMEASFDFGSFFSPANRLDLILPFPITQETDRWGNTLAVIGRMKPGVSVETAQAELDVVREQIRAANPERRYPWGLKLTALREYVSGRLRRAVLVLAFAVGVVMLIVCANLSNLLLARAATRRKELAVRAALGAGRLRIARQMLTESVVLSSCGALLGLFLAFAATRFLAGIETISIPLLRGVELDGTTLAFTVLVAFATGIVFGAGPALRSSGADLQDALKESGRGSSEGKGRGWVRSALVVSEVALACVLLVGAGLLIRSFLSVLDVDLGFQPERVAALRVDPGPRYATPMQYNGYVDEVLRRVRAAPGVEGVGLTDALPLGRNRSWGIGAKGESYPPGKFPTAFVRIISEGYFKAMGIPLRSGRDFEERDSHLTEKVIIINETLARILWPDRDPIGQIAVNNRNDYRVVGVVGDVRHLTLEQQAGPEMYYPIRLGFASSIDLVVKTKLPPEALASSVRETLKPLEPNLATNEFRTLGQIVDRAASPRRFVVVLLGGFAALALVLASLGIYGVVSYSVGQRTQEIGIRMALGATPGDVRRRVVTQTLRLAVIGISVGTAGAYAVTRSLNSLLYGVTAGDPPTFASMAALLAAVAVAAGYLPARRASRIDPIIALRAE